MRRRILCLVLALVLAAAVGFRIYQVNTADYMQYFPKRVEYSRGEEVPLNNGKYYFTRGDLEGYTIQVTDARIEKTEDFLSEHHAPDGFLKRYKLNGSLGLPRNYLCIVTVVFRYYGDQEVPSPVLLDEFQIIGPDYRANVLTEMNKLDDFNPALQGSNRFAIVSGKPFTVELAYFVDEDWESGMSRDYFLHSNPQLVATYYPEERVISIFE